MRRKRPDRSPRLVQVIPSRWDDEPILRGRSALLGLAGVDGVSLEFAVTETRTRFLIRAVSAAAMEQARAQIGAAYPQAEFRALSTQEHPDLDPAWRATGEEMAALDLRLRHGASLPIAWDWRNGGDPLIGILAASSTLESGERVVYQAALAPAPAGWADGLRSRIAVPLPRSAQAIDAGPATEILPILALFGIGAIGMQVYRWYESGNLLPLAGAGAAALVGLPLAMALATRVLAGRQPLERRLVDEKLAHPACSVQLRIIAFGPLGCSRDRLRELAQDVARTYQAFDHAAANGLRPRRWRGDPTSPALRRGLFQQPAILNAAELAGLWHLPCEPSSAIAGEHVASRLLSPAAEDTDRGCRVGVSGHRGDATSPVQMPLSLLFRNQLIVAKTRRGKSTLLLRMAEYFMQRMAAQRERVTLVVVDPHQDLAEAVLGAVPPGLDERVVYLNLGDREHPVGLNLLDVALFGDRDRTTENVITMMHRLWPDNWGPRMEGALRASVSCLHEANVARTREEQYTLLDVAPMLMSVDFREEVLKQVPDRALWTWWRDNYDRINRTFQQQTANPVTTKVGRFLITEAARLTVGQSRSTIDPRALLRDGGVLVVNSAVGTLGEGGAALMGATLLNLMGLVVEEQVSLPPSQRCRLVALVDESTTIAAADYQWMLSELSKYGASFVLVTQSLAKLDAIDRALRPTIFSNIDGLTVFQVSAEDARYLVPELGADIETCDLTDLDDFTCYARWSAAGRRLATFSLRLDPPPAADPDRVAAIARRSAERFGCPREEVQAEINRALAERGGLTGPPSTPQLQEIGGTQPDEPPQSGIQATSQVNAHISSGGAKSKGKPRR